MSEVKVNKLNTRTNTALTIQQNSTTAMTIDTSQNVLVGKTTTTRTDIGSEMRPTGFIRGTREDGHPFDVVRTNSDGDIMKFYRDAGQVGQITAYTTGISINLGGTGSANALDDYEEGTFTPTYLGSTSNPSVTYDTTVRYGAYTKIGRIVYFNLVNRTDAVSSSGSGDLRVGGLPFNADNSAFSSVSRYGCNIGGFTGFSSSGSSMTGYIINDYIELFETHGASTVSTSELVNGGNRNEIQITGFYVTSS